MAPSPIIGLLGKAGSGKDTVGMYLTDYYNAVCVAQADPIKRFCMKVFGFDEPTLWGPSELRNVDQVFGEYDREGVGYKFDENSSQFLTDIVPKEDQKAARQTLDAWFTKMDKIMQKEGRLSARTALQQLGTEWGRNLSLNIWSDHAINTCKTLLEGGYRYNKFDGLYRMKDVSHSFAIITDVRFRNECLNIKYCNGSVVRILRPQAGLATDSHASEAEMDSIPRHFYDHILNNFGTIDDLYNDIELNLMQKLRDGQ